MSRPVAKDGTPVSTPSWSIYDAGAFSVGKSDLVHAPAHFPKGSVVVGKCGVVGYTGYDSDYRRARWRDSLVTCTMCKTR
jgi:hypothetical protein